ncbi:MAG: phosphohistidine phosphatase SixA [Elusimicrobiota bacterium]|nr:phosphohistidine phosphatase SixA [Elusimicrobiota bacterium]
MKLIFVRHGIAGDKVKFALSGRPDAARPLTAKGVKKMKKAAGGLKKITGRADAVVSSPYTRAVQTAQILAKKLGIKKTEKTAALGPSGRLADLFAYLRKYAAAATVVLAGHEPHLGNIISQCLGGPGAAFVSLGKGGACMVEFKGKPASGKAALVWLLEPGHLQRLG